MVARTPAANQARRWVAEEMLRLGEAVRWGSVVVRVHFSNGIPTAIDELERHPSYRPAGRPSPPEVGGPEDEGTLDADNLD